MVHPCGETITRLDEGVTALQAAVFAGELYVLDHPTVRQQLDRAAELLGRVTAEHGDATVLFLEDRVAFGDRILPSSAKLIEGIGDRLRQRGIDYMRLNRGFGPEDAQEVARALSKDAPADSCTESRGRYTFGVLAEDQAHCTPATGGQPPEQADGPQADQLREAWQMINAGNSAAAENVACLVADIRMALLSTGGVLPPLATLKRFDEYTFVHTLNVAMLSAALAEAVGLTGRQVHDLTVAALLHDVGKECIPPEILNKKGKFTDEEFRIVQRHPVDGARMLYNAGKVPAVAPIVAFEHHMHADGGGYPRVNRPRRLHLASRIVQVADVFDALRTVRPYRPAMPVEKIVGILLEQRGTKLDAELVETFIAQIVMAESSSAQPMNESA